MRFETGDDKLKELELGVFVGAGRFRVETGKPVVVEYKVSRVSRGGDWKQTGIALARWQTISSGTASSKGIVFRMTEIREFDAAFVLNPSNFTCAIVNRVLVECNVLLMGYLS